MTTDGETDGGRCPFHQKGDLDGICTCPHCPRCGYTKFDQQLHGDHQLCPGEIPDTKAGAESQPPDEVSARSRAPRRPITVRFPTGDYEHLEMLAKEDTRSPGDFIRWLVRHEWLRRQGEI